MEQITLPTHKQDVGIVTRRYFDEVTDTPLTGRTHQLRGETHQKHLREKSQRKCGRNSGDHHARSNGQLEAEILLSKMMNTCRQVKHCLCVHELFMNVLCCSLHVFVVGSVLARTITAKCWAVPPRVDSPFEAQPFRAPPCLTAPETLQRSPRDPPETLWRPSLGALLPLLQTAQEPRSKKLRSFFTRHGWSTIQVATRVPRPAGRRIRCHAFSLHSKSV